MSNVGSRHQDNHRRFGRVATLIAFFIAQPTPVSANPEASIYDTRALAMGLTGTTYLERPAALVLNPANLEGIQRFGFGLSFTMLMVKSFAPVQGPNTKVTGPLALGPLPSIFLAGRVAPRWSLALAFTSRPVLAATIRTQSASMARWSAHHLTIPQTQTPKLASIKRPRT